MPDTEPIVVESQLDLAELYGLVAEFDTPRALLSAARQVGHAGWRRAEAYSPFPVHGLTEALGKPPTRLPMITLLGGLLGAAAGYGLQYWVNVINYPMNIGGRPYNSWPAFLPVIFELAVLGAALSSVLGMLALNGLPMPYHPLFNVPRFKLASRDRFFLMLPARDPKFERRTSREFLESLQPLAVYEVPR
jgi:hypothetical protein